MLQTETTPHRAAITLPNSAPHVRLTAGAGTAGEKTWCLRRPVTMIGSKRPAHIVIHDPATAPAHCVIINTGKAVLMRDLHSGTGTMWNHRMPTGPVALADGDVITIGRSTMLIRIEYPDGDPENTAQDASTIRFPEPLTVCVDDSDTVWRVEHAISLIGRHPESDIRLDHPNVASRHAVIFEFLSEPAIFDTGQGSGVWVGGQHCVVARVDESERFMIGPFALVLGPPGAAPSGLVTNSDRTRGEATQDNLTRASDLDAANRLANNSEVAHSPFAIWQQTKQDQGVTLDAGSSSKPVADWLKEISSSGNESWERLQVVAQPGDPPGSDGAQPATTPIDSKKDGGEIGPATEMTARVASSGPRAAVRGAKAQGGQRQTDLARREADLRRREEELTRRWTQLLSACCPHCNHSLASPDPMDSPGNSAK